MEFFSPIELNEFELKDFLVHNTASTGLAHKGGRLIYNGGTLLYSDGTNWQTLLTVATAKTTYAHSLVAASGHLYLKDNSSAPVNLSDITAANLVTVIGDTAVNRATADASGNTITSTYATKTAVGNADITAVAVTSSKITLTRADGNLEATIPTWNQSTTGNAGSATKLKTARNLWGNSFDGSAAVSGALTFTAASSQSATAHLEVVTIDGVDYLHTRLPFFSDSSVSSGGTGTGGSGGGSTYSRLDRWSDYTDSKAGYVLSALLGNDLNTRVTSLEGGSATTVTTTGSGNAVTSISKSGTTITATKGKTFIETSAIGAASGVVPLDTDSKIALTYLPDAILGQVIYGGTVAPGTTTTATLSANGKKKLGITSATITLTNDTGTYGYTKCDGMFFIVSANGSFAGTAFLTGDWLIATASGWKKIDNTDAVTGVKGNSETDYRIGNVNITKANIGLGNVENTALSTWAGSANITTLGTVTTGTWQGTKIADSYISSAATWNAKQNAINANNKLSWSYISSTPTTIAGYGITDAKIDNGVITLGSNTITPLTASSTLDATKLSGTVPQASLNATNIKDALGTTAVNRATADASGNTITSTYLKKADLTHSYNVTTLDSNNAYTTTTNFTTQNLVAILYDSNNNVVITDTSIVSSTVSGKTVYNIKIIFAKAIGTKTFRLVVIGY